MGDAAKYLYCIVRCPEERVFEEIAPIGGGDGPVYTVSSHGLAAVVSDSPTTEYESTRSNVLAHQRVQERVMREYSQLPVRFGTVANSGSPIQDIQKLLEKRGQEFDQLLADLEGRVELGLKALWRDEPAVYQELVEEHPAVRTLRNSLMGKPPQVVRFQGIRLGELVKAALEQKKAREAEELLAPLRPLAGRVQENEVIVDRMVLNAAFLVDQSREREFDGAVRKLDEEWGQRTLFKYVGPVPPYNFVNIVVSWEEVLED